MSIGQGVGCGGHPDTDTACSKIRCCRLAGGKDQKDIHPKEARPVWMNVFVSKDRMGPLEDLCDPFLVFQHSKRHQPKTPARCYPSARSRSGRCFRTMLSAASRAALLSPASRIASSFFASESSALRFSSRSRS